MTKRVNVFVSLGERVRRLAISMSGTDSKGPKPMEGRVIYIHPKGRFHTVEFSTMGGPVRESFAGIMRSECDVHGECFMCVSCGDTGKCSGCTRWYEETGERDGDG